MLPKHKLIKTPEYLQELISNVMWNHPKNVYAKGKKRYLSSPKCDAVAEGIVKELFALKKPTKKKAAKKK